MIEPEANADKGAARKFVRRKGAQNHSRIGVDWCQGKRCSRSENPKGEVNSSSLNGDDDGGWKENHLTAWSLVGSRGKSGGQFVSEGLKVSGEAIRNTAGRNLFKGKGSCNVQGGSSRTRLHQLKRGNGLGQPGAWKEIGKRLQYPGNSPQGKSWKREILT